jgi:hypothetical protein
MNKIISVLAITLMAGLVGLGFSSAKAAEGDTAPAPATTPAPAPKVTKPKLTKPFASDESLQRYWAYEKERLTLMESHDQDVLAVYDKYKWDTKEARAEVKPLDQKYTADMKALRDKYSDVIKQRKEAGNNRSKLDSERQAFLKAHPDVRSDIASLRKDVKDLRAKIAAKEHAGAKPASKTAKPKTTSKPATQPQ